MLQPPEVTMPLPWWLRPWQKTRWAQQRVAWGYGRVALRLLFVNFIFQRILGLNATAPFSVNFRSRVNGGENIRLGRGVGASFAASGGLYVTGLHGLTIGDGTVIGPNVGILTANHDLYDRSLATADGPVVIGRNCWIGMNAVILPGVTLGDNVTVTAGAIVTKSFPSDVVIGGAPARVFMELSLEKILDYRRRHGITVTADLAALRP